LAIVTSPGHPELFAAWVAAYLSPYPLFTHIRAMAKHAMTEQSPNMLRNTGITKTGLVSRFFLHLTMLIIILSITHWHQHLAGSCQSYKSFCVTKNAVAKPPSY
jgi:hypothetical protein